MVAVAARLEEWWGRRVFVAAEDVTRLRLYLSGYEAGFTLTGKASG
ncbi:hypothetical protein ABTZ78_08640 [Streptomyces bauhiniae]